MKWILPLSVLIIFEGMADLLAENWSIKGGYLLAVSSLVLYAIGNVFWLFALKDGSGLGKGAGIFSVATAVVAIALGFFLYKEPVTKLQFIGLVLGIISLAFIFWK